MARPAPSFPGAEDERASGSPAEPWHRQSGTGRSPRLEASGLSVKPVSIQSNFDDVFDSAAGHLNAQHGRLVSAAVWLLDHVEQWQGDGLWTPEAYVRWRTGVAPATASKIVDVARRADEFAACLSALQRGELSLDQIAPITRHAPGWCDAQMAGLAPRCTVAQISKICSGVPVGPRSRRCGNGRH